MLKCFRLARSKWTFLSITERDVKKVISTRYTRKEKRAGDNGGDKGRSLSRGDFMVSCTLPFVSKCCWCQLVINLNRKLFPAASFLSLKVFINTHLNGNIENCGIEFIFDLLPFGNRSKIKDSRYGWAYIRILQLI